MENASAMVDNQIVGVLHIRGYSSLYCGLNFLLRIGDKHQSNTHLPLYFPVAEVDLLIQLRGCRGKLVNRHFADVFIVIAHQNFEISVIVGLSGVVRSQLIFSGGRDFLGGTRPGIGGLLLLFTAGSQSQHHGKYQKGDCEPCPNQLFAFHVPFLLN